MLYIIILDQIRKELRIQIGFTTDIKYKLFAIKQYYPFAKLHRLWKFEKTDESKVIENIQKVGDKKTGKGIYELSEGDFKNFVDYYDSVLPKVEWLTLLPPSKIQKLSKFQKIILLYMGIKMNQKKHPFLTRTEISTIAIILNTKSNVFSVVLTNAIKSLVKRKLIKKIQSHYYLTEDGKLVAKDVHQILKQNYGNVDWAKIKLFYEE